MTNSLNDAKNGDSAAKTLQGAESRVCELKQARLVFVQTLVLNLIVAVMKIAWGFGSS
jgi:hypothetical protein